MARTILGILLVLAGLLSLVTLVDLAHGLMETYGEPALGTWGNLTGPFASAFLLAGLVGAVLLLTGSLLLRTGRLGMVLVAACLAVACVATWLAAGAGLALRF